MSWRKILERVTNKGADVPIINQLNAALASPILMPVDQVEQTIQAYLKGSPTLITRKERMESRISEYEDAHAEVYMVDGIGNSSVGVYFVDNVAVMNIKGSLISHEVTDPCMQTPPSYEAITKEFDSIMGIDDVDVIIARIESGGGSSSQCFDMVDNIYNSRGKGKKLIAVVDDYAYSGAFALASAFDEIHVTRSGGVGSVGVYIELRDMTKLLDAQGIEISYVFAGDHKVDGCPYVKLSEEGRGHIQDTVNDTYDLFVATVARNLDMTPSDVIATQARTYHGQKAVDIGFANSISTFREVLIDNITEVMEMNIKKSENGKLVPIDGEDQKIEDQKIEDQKIEDQKITMMSHLSLDEHTSQQLLLLDLSVESFGSMLTNMSSTNNSGIDGNVAPDDITSEKLKREEVRKSWANAFNRI